MSQCKNIGVDVKAWGEEGWGGLGWVGMAGVGWVVETAG